MRTGKPAGTHTGTYLGTPPGSQRLSDLAPGEEALIAAVHADEALHQRLAALGFRIGRSVRLLRRGVWAGPLHVRLGATDVMLRRAEACMISIAPISPISTDAAK